MCKKRTEVDKWRPDYTLPTKFPTIFTMWTHDDSESMTSSSLIISKYTEMLNTAAMKWTTSTIIIFSKPQFKFCTVNITKDREIWSFPPLLLLVRNFRC